MNTAGVCWKYSYWSHCPDVRKDDERLDISCQITSTKMRHHQRRNGIHHDDHSFVFSYLDKLKVITTKTEALYYIYSLFTWRRENVTKSVLTFRRDILYADALLQHTYLFCWFPKTTTTTTKNQCPIHPKHPKLPKHPIYHHHWHRNSHVIVFVPTLKRR